MDYEVIKKVKAELSARRTIAEERYEYEMSKVKALPVYQETDKALRTATVMLSKALSQCKDTAPIERAIVGIQAKLDKIVHNAGILDSYHTCTLCHDTGQLADGRLCSCFLELYREYEKKVQGYTEIPPFTFADNRISDIDCAQRDNLIKVYSSLDRFCSLFPETPFRNMVIIGNVGTGKSMLMSAMANAIAFRGFSVKYITAFDLNQALLAYHLEHKSALLDSLIDCDILLIDDLGTEQIYKNVTVEYLYYIIDKRHSKHTVISTNLNDTQLKERYHERIYSRLFSNQCKKIILTGDDLRLLGRS